MLRLIAAAGFYAADLKRFADFQNTVNRNRQMIGLIALAGHVNDAVLIHVPPQIEIGRLLKPNLDNAAVEVLRTSHRIDKRFTAGDNCDNMRFASYHPAPSFRKE